MNTPPSDTSWLTLQEASELARRTTKTLYRWMDQDKLTYQLNGRGRRLINRIELTQVIYRDSVSRPVPSHQDLQCLTREVAALRVQMARQEALLREIIGLYRPESPEALRRKQTILKNLQHGSSAHTT